MRRGDERPSRRLHSMRVLTLLLALLTLAVSFPAAVGEHGCDPVPGGTLCVMDDHGESNVPLFLRSSTDRLFSYASVGQASSPNGYVFVAAFATRLGSTLGASSSFVQFGWEAGGTEMRVTWIFGSASAASTSGMSYDYQQTLLGSSCSEVLTVRTAAGMHRVEGACRVVLPNIAGTVDPVFELV